VNDGVKCILRNIFEVNDFTDFIFVCVCVYIYNRTQRPILYIYTNERTNLIYGCGIFLRVRKKLKNRENWKKNN